MVNPTSLRLAAILPTLYLKQFSLTKKHTIMETQTATAKKGVQRDIYATITGKIIGKLHNGIVPWRVSWAAAGLPQNLVTGNEYQSVNRILLASLGYSRNLFITSKQLETLDGAILPKERPHVISFFWRCKL